MTPLPRTRGRAFAVSLALAIALALTGCSGASEVDPEASVGTGAGDGDGGDGGTWTVLHYSVADNNLEGAMAGDVNELGEVGSTGTLKVREYMDRSPDYGDDAVLDQGSWVGARVFDIGEDGTTNLVQDLGDANSADPQTLADFMAQGFSDLPADHYGLIISDHGGQWNGIGQDESSGGELLTLDDLGAGISAGLEGAGLDRLDLLGFDACLMAGYEVASAMAPYADRMVASQESEPGHGWDYHALSVAADDDGATPEQLGTAIIDGFEAQSVEAGDVAGVTLSMLDLTQMGTLDTALSEFSTALAGAADAAPAVGRAQTEVQGFGKSPDPVQDQHLSDLGQLAASVSQESPDVSAQADALSAAIDTVVLDDFAGEARAGSTGLSIYLPPTADLYSPGYDAITSAAPWAGFLGSYYGIGRSIPSDAVATFAQDEPDVVLDDDGGVTLSAGYDPAAQDNLTEATISYAFLEDDGTVSFFGEESAELGTTEDPTVVGSYDFTRLEMSDGQDTATAYVDLGVDADSGIATIDVPMSYYAPEDVDQTAPQDVLLSLVLDSDSGDITSETYYAYDETTSTYGEAELDPAGIISPELPNYDADGNETWLPTSDVGLYADLEGISYDFVPIDPGTELQVELDLYDFGGNASYSSTTVAVP